MSNITWLFLGVLLFSMIDYLLSVFDVIAPEKQRWSWFAKRSRIQKIGILSTIFVVLLIVNYLTY
ncbi:hypothetical protein [Gottfriedia luciferensis]|uniref:hypothetical protein n=1 Tax=Gottfriedia luciferensis TaxID=178774 RepID=UPI000B453093|nr:hypothetical protein [Gottfriedia luciferensis]